MAQRLTASEIRALRAENLKARARDFALSKGITEAELVAAYLGQTATAIMASPDAILPLVKDLGEVLALTRNEACVHERHGIYEDYHGGAHAQMVLGEEIDLRIFATHWVHAYAVTDLTGETAKRSLQIFDAAGDAIHKIHLVKESNVEAFDRLVASLRLPEQSDSLSLAPRAEVEPAKADPAKAEVLRAEWDQMTDTHQFLRLVRRLKMNRLGAYRIVGGPRARKLAPAAVSEALYKAAEEQIPVMIFVGNMGCIQIHGGTVSNILPMGPWINVMDPRFNLHLRTDKIAEVWCVTKPTQRGDAISIEAFDARGEIILQIFGSRKHGRVADWDALTTQLPALEETLA